MNYARTLHEALLLLADLLFALPRGLFLVFLLVLLPLLRFALLLARFLLFLAGRFLKGG